MQLWRAVRVVGLRRGVATSSALEPPFVGRDRELRLVKELLSRDRRRASDQPRLGDRRRRDRQVPPGVGVREVLRRPRRRRVVASRAVPRVRGRGRVLGARRDGAWAGRDPGGRGLRLRVGRSSVRSSTTSCPIPNERRFVEPRLAQLLGLEDRPPGDEANLFAAWRLFFERMSDTDPVIMLFEDIHWADSALLDFIEHLLDWSRERPIFILTLSRPELLDRRPTWGAGKRGFTLDLPRAAAAGGDGDTAGRTAPGLPVDVLEKILRAGRGRSLLCGGDGPDAARPRPDRPGGERLPGDGTDRDARGPGDAAGADRRAARRARRPRSVGCCSAPRCSGSRSRCRGWPR